MSDYPILSLPLADSTNNYLHEQCIPFLHCLSVKVKYLHLKVYNALAFWEEYQPYGSHYRHQIARL